MSCANNERDIQKDYSEVLIGNSVVKRYVKGMSRFLILWIIKYNESIHGYEILKELYKFFDVLIDDNALKKSSPSNIYPILNKLEKERLIVSEFKIVNNKKLKYFRITGDGEYLLEYLYSRFGVMHSNDQWKTLFEDMG